jgi:hypothetical protein
MDRIMRRFSRKASIKLNHCRRYLQVLTTSDLFLHDGLRIHPDIYRGKRASGRRAQYDWPDISPPSKSCWAAWKHFLNTEFPDGSQPNANIDTWNRLPRYSHELCSAMTWKAVLFSVALMLVGESTNICALQLCVVYLLSSSWMAHK